MRDHKQALCEEHSMNHRCVALTLACALLVGLSSARADAQAAKLKPAAARCDTVLTQKEAAAIVGSGFQGPSVREPRPGFTECEWQGSDANFSFTFANTKALQADQTTAAAAFDLDLVAVENDQRKREELPNIGVKAARVSLGDDVYLVEVQRADGVARMILSKIPEDQLIALARAIAKP
jgi:hypothetical protein